MTDTTTRARDPRETARQVTDERLIAFLWEVLQARPAPGDGAPAPEGDAAPR